MWRNAYLAAVTCLGLSFGHAWATDAVHYRHVVVDGISVFYREAGDPRKPTILLLHGFPSSSFEFHELIPLLASHFHILAPDYPGMGYSQVPPSGVLAPNFDNLAKILNDFLVQRRQSHVILYMHDFGGPVGMRLAVTHPGLVSGLVFQNTTITLSGYNPARLKVFERIGGQATPEKLAEAEESASEERDRFLHQTGARDAEALNPDDWAVDTYAFGIPESRRYMAQLLTDIMSNVAHYAEWASYLTSKQPRTLIVWGENDPVFSPAAAKDIKSDVPAAKLYNYDGGHFMLDEFSREVAGKIIKTFSDQK